MPRLILPFLLSVGSLFLIAVAQDPELDTGGGDTKIDDSVVRLPNQMHRRFMGRFRNSVDAKFVPGGALIFSFNRNEDNLVSKLELQNGIDDAFNLADENRSGYLTVFEQQAWARQLEVKDATLSNPVRFDPNLNGSISYEEFASVITRLAEQYEEANGEILIEALFYKEEVEEEAKPDGEKLRKNRGRRRK